MTKQERITYLQERQQMLENFKNIDNIHAFDSFVYMEIENEKSFLQNYPTMEDSSMLSRLNDIQFKIRSARQSLRKRKRNDALDSFEMAFLRVNQDYDEVINLFKAKNTSPS